MKLRTRKLTEKGLNEFEKRLLKNIKEDGWHVNGITDNPAWIYSVGIHASFGQPEIIIFGREMETMYEMIARYVELVKAGLVVSSRKPIEGLIEKHACAFRAVNSRWRDKLMLSSCWYYLNESFPAVQCFWPDAKGAFPWSENFNKRMKPLQPLLYERSSEKTGMPSLFEEEPWHFEDSPDTACFTTNRVMEGAPITYVSHDFEGDWQFHGDDDISEVAPQLVGLDCMVEMDASLQELHELPCGWAAERKSPKHKWKRFRNVPFPNYQEDGYYLVDAVAMAEHRDDLKPPTERRRQNCKVGQYVKLLFRFADENTAAKDLEVERMWVQITEVDSEEGLYTGVLDNDPNHSAAKCGDVVQFHPLHIAEILKG
jgi:Domain of unknown function (DUF4262)